MRIEAHRGWLALDLGELWAYRDLVYFFVWRDIKVRYKQTAIGAAWAVLQPVLTMLVFSLFFGKLAKIPSQGLPYPIFYYSALLPWMYFATAMQGATEHRRGAAESHHQNLFSARGAAHLPRFCRACWISPSRSRVFLVMMAYYRMVPTARRHLAAALHAAGGSDGSGRGLVALRTERAVPRCALRRALPGAVLDVCLAGGLPEFPGARKVALALRIESHGGRHRRISLGADRARPAAGHPAGGVVGWPWSCWF